MDKFHPQFKGYCSHVSQLGITEVKRFITNYCTYLDEESEEQSQVTMVTIDSVGSSDDDDDVTDEVIVEEEEEVDQCKLVVDQIRKDEFGIGVQLSEDGQRLMKVGSVCLCLAGWLAS